MMGERAVTAPDLMTFGGPAEVATSAGRIAPVERSVVDFDATTTRYDPPGTDLLGTIDKSKFKESAKTVSLRLRSYMNNPLVRTFSVPTNVTATLEQSDPASEHPKRNGSRSANIGLIGRDEFWLKTGLLENFEGGHIISHSLWDDDDNDVDMAGSYENLVPMSRTLN